MSFWWWVAIFIAIGIIIAISRERNLAAKKKAYDQALGDKQRSIAIIAGRAYYEEFNRQNEKSRITDIETRIMNDLKIANIE